MRLNRQLFATVLLALGLGTIAPAQPNPDRHGPGGPPGSFVFMGPGNFGMFGGPDALNPLVMMLADLNLSPDFSLTDDQKQKIQAIRDDFRKQQEKWREEHAEEIKKFDEEFQALHDAGGPPDPDEVRALMEARMELMSGAPNGEDAAEQVRALLTPQQAEQLEARKAKMEEQQQMFRPGNWRRR